MVDQGQKEFQKLLQETCAGSAEDVTGGMDFLRFHLCRRQEERKAAVLAPYWQEDGEEVPEAMDEFEYTDWKISNS